MRVTGGLMTLLVVVDNANGLIEIELRLRQAGLEEQYGLWQGELGRLLGHAQLEPRKSCAKMTNVM